jgi:pimeloyl-ACP methyl ester carboxylesterase
MPHVRKVSTPRLEIHCRVEGPEDAPPVVLIHGNVSSLGFWEPLAGELAAGHRVIAPDLRGYGDTEPAPIDATRGLRDFSDDLHALLTALDVRRPAWLVGWSVGAGVAMQYAIDHAAAVAGLVLESPVSPYGFGGTRDAAGTPNSPDFAGSGGGTANPEFVRLLAAKDRGAEGPVSPRSVMNTCYFAAPSGVDPALEEAYLESMLQTRTGDDHYPGDLTTSPHWPGVAPGTRGMNNAISPKYLDLSPFAAIDPRPPVLWVRGVDDVIVSDTSLFDLANLGRLGLVPGWPGEADCPAQPMVAQMRAVLDAYRARGGRYDELLLGRCGHSPHIERPRAFLAALHNFFAGG